MMHFLYTQWLGGEQTATQIKSFYRKFTQQDFSPDLPGAPLSGAITMCELLTDQRADF